jgi:hypothetical protein
LNYGYEDGQLPILWPFWTPVLQFHLCSSHFVEFKAWK